MARMNPVEFRYEAEMLAPVASWLESEGLSVKREYLIPWGICDLVGCRLDPQKIERRRKYGQHEAIGPMLRIALLLEIPEADEGRCVTLGKLTRVYGPFVGEAKVEQEILRLLKGRFIDSPKRNHFRRRVSDWMPLHERIVAVELKLSRVEEALRQAAGHLEFADESYVALPLEHGRRVVGRAKREDFEAQSVGVLGVARHGTQVLLRAEPRRRDSLKPAQAHCAERFWREAVTSS